MFKKILTVATALLIMTNTVFANANSITIKSLDSNNKPLKGFVYEVHDLQNNVIHQADFTKELEEFRLSNLKDGKYVIKEIKTNEKYEKSKDISIELPTKEGERSVLVVPKHVEKETKKGNEYTETSVSTLSYSTIASISVTVLYFVYILSSRSKSEK